MTREFLIERIRRQVYGAQPSADASITKNIVNSYISDGVAAAAKEHWKENIKMDNCSFVNNSFYTTFRGIAITAGQEFGYYTAALPQIPVALGNNEGLASIRVLDSDGATISRNLMQLNVNEINYYDELPMPNVIPYWNEGGAIIFNSPNYSLLNCTSIARMVSAGETSLSSTLNVPGEWIPFISEYVMKQLLIEKSQPQDKINDGVDNYTK